MTSARGLSPGDRALRLAATPTYSIVLVSAGSRADLEASLAVLEPQCRELNTELVVVRSTNAEEFRSLAGAWPSVLWMPAPDNVSVPQLKAIGITAAEGDIVIFTTDAAPPPEGWVRARTRLQQAGSGE